MNRPVEVSAELTPLQRKYLEILYEHRHTPPRAGPLFARSWPSYALLLALLGLVAVLAYSVNRYEPLLLAGGLVAGAMLRDYASLLRSIQLWPATVAVLDHRKLAELLDKPASAHPDTTD